MSRHGLSTRRHDERDWPYTWGRKHRPTGRKGWPCRIVKNKGAVPGVVTVQFKSDGRAFIVERTGLQRRDQP